jgi:GTPase SAR1 family protein
VVGDNNGGKTSLLVTYTTNEFPTEYTPTVFDSYAANITFENKLICLGKPFFQLNIQVFGILLAKKVNFTNFKI